MINLSYVLATKNKLEYTKKILSKLLCEVQPDEEIVVVDGASTDGTVEYLEQLFFNKKIHQLISEPDKCQAHGSNKGLLMAKGKIIKILTDDDAYHYSSIQRCKNFMLENTDVDLVVGNVAYQGHGNNVYPWIFEEGQRNYVQWISNNGKPFWFGDQGLFVRRSSIPLFGLWHTGVSCIDVEKSIMLTALRQITIVWYTGIVSCSIINQDSVTNIDGHNQKSVEWKNKIIDFYSTDSLLIKTLKNISRLTKLYLIKKKIKKKFSNTSKSRLDEVNSTNFEFANGTYFQIEDAYRWLEISNKSRKIEFLGLLKK